MSYAMDAEKRDTLAAGVCGIKLSSLPVHAQKIHSHIQGIALA
jgi:hypothetical protein